MINFLKLFSLVVTRGHSWSLVVTRSHSFTFRHDHQLSGIFYSLRYHIAGFIFNSAPRRIFKMASIYPHCLMEDFCS